MWWARWWWGMAVLLAVSFTGCCGPTYGEGSKAVVGDNLLGWKYAAGYAKAAGWPEHDGVAGLPPDDVEFEPGQEPPNWWRRYVGWYAGALQLQARANGEKLTRGEATMMAEQAIHR